MTQYRLPYGKTHLTFDLPDGLNVQLLAPRDAPPAADPLAEVARALTLSPLPSPCQGEGQGVRVAIAINDKTRPVPHHHLLPPLLKQLDGLGIAPEAITLIIATGTHAPMPREEYGLVLPPEIIGRYPVICHDAEDRANLVHLGQTSRGVEVWANRQFMAADLRIVVGNIEPHQFMGWSGGAKSAAIGLGGREMINANHALLTAPGAQIGHYEDNPVRREVEEIGALMGVHYAVNAILNDHKQIVHALAGDPRAVMQAGIPLARQICQVAVPAPFDLLIISPGGHPKDINLYQAQKALGHAILVMKPGGTVILAAACPEGTGSKGYEAFMADPAMTTHQAVLARYAREGYRIGPHKAWQISRDASRIRLLTITQMPADFARHLLLNPVAGPAEALALALPALPPNPVVGVMPLANATIPALKGDWVTE